ncbi:MULTISPECIES: hypothetical protein [unclassified Streptomyces]|uniref:hypothetical protein n=1 Tax=unclassified Streptomyces TaxID=2593676 RepID=UPI00332BB067
MLREVRQNGTGYALTSTDTHVAVTGLRGDAVSGNGRAAARKALSGLKVKLLQAGEGAASGACPGDRIGTRSWQ